MPSLLQARQENHYSEALCFISLIATFVLRANSMLTTSTPVLKDLFGESCRLWLVGATHGDMVTGNLFKLLGKLETVESHDDLTPVILSFRSPNGPVMEIDTPIKTIRCTMLRQSSPAEYESSLRFFIDEVVGTGHKVVAVVIEDFDKTYVVDGSDKRDYTHLLRRIRIMALKENFVCIVQAPLGCEAIQLKRAVGHEFLNVISMNGYFDHSRVLEQEADSVIYYSVDDSIIRFIAGKHRSCNIKIDRLITTV